MTNKEFKPYQLVLVQEDGYNYIGQVISRITPENTYMVRRVPGDPSTMEEFHSSKLKTIDQDRKWVQYATVAGLMGFPIDMLRYDYCVPVNFKLEEDRWGSKTKPIIINDDKELIVARATRRKNDEWTKGRWSSFLWGIKELKTLPIEE